MDGGWTKVVRRGKKRGGARLLGDGGRTNGGGAQTLARRDGGGAAIQESSRVKNCKATRELAGEGQGDFDVHETLKQKDPRVEVTTTSSGNEAFFINTVLEVIDEVVIIHLFAQPIEFDLPQPGIFNLENTNEGDESHE
ncbi:hypothetical protein Scep_007795 [Stephania cephalantha]|uniref:Uncharacterized protein n=1 Tax=Stephania cephalantha TaxID=152367 RepID=A0AAP0KAI4_9MAGN